VRRAAGPPRRLQGDRQRDATGELGGVGTRVWGDHDATRGVGDTPFGPTQHTRPPPRLVLKSFRVCVRVKSFSYCSKVRLHRVVAHPKINKFTYHIKRVVSCMMAVF